VLQELFSKNKSDGAINFSDRYGNGDVGSVALDNSNLQTSDFNLVLLERMLMFSYAALCSKSHFNGLIPHIRNAPHPLYFYDNIYKMCFIGN